MVAGSKGEQEEEGGSSSMNETEGSKTRQKEGPEVVEHRYIDCLGSGRAMPKGHTFYHFGTNSCSAQLGSDPQKVYSMPPAVSPGQHLESTSELHISYLRLSRAVRTARASF